MKHAEKKPDKTTEQAQPKMWSGRFEKPTEKIVDDFNSSLSYDMELYAFDIEGSIAHSKMLCKAHLLTCEEQQDIEKGLLGIQKDIEEKKLNLVGEDVHMSIESELTRRIGIAGKKLHTARSRNDQVATDFRMYIRNQIDTLQALLKQLISSLIKLANKHLQTIISGYTHLQKAQPVTLAHHFMAYVEMFKRDYERLFDTRARVNILPLGSGALATTTYPIDREYTATLLGFDSVCQNSIDGVSDRDFAVEYTFDLSLISMHLSRFCEELILWNTTEFSLITLDDAYSTGSSIMPQKKNPDIPELIRGKTGRVYGSLIQLLTMLKGLPLAYNKDMQEDKECVFDASKTVQNCLIIFSRMLETTTFNISNMRKGAEEGFTNATDVADYLVKNGVPFRDAHEVCGKIVLSCIKNSKNIQSLSLTEFQKFSPIFKEDILQSVKIENVVSSRNVTGGPSCSAVQKHIEKIVSYFGIIL